MPSLRIRTISISRRSPPRTRSLAAWSAGISSGGQCGGEPVPSSSSDSVKPVIRQSAAFTRTRLPCMSSTESPSCSVARSASARTDPAGSSSTGGGRCSASIARMRLFSSSSSCSRELDGSFMAGSFFRDISRTATLPDAARRLADGIGLGDGLAKACCQYRYETRREERRSRGSIRNLSHQGAAGLKAAGAGWSRRSRPSVAGPWPFTEERTLPSQSHGRHDIPRRPRHFVA